MLMIHTFLLHFTCFLVIFEIRFYQIQYVFLVFILPRYLPISSFSLANNFIHISPSRQPLSSYSPVQYFRVASNFVKTARILQEHSIALFFTAKGGRSPGTWPLFPILFRQRCAHFKYSNFYLILTSLQNIEKLEFYWKK